jgi:FKBP-type peptidyl-prolyl cis-trans isomerase FklB
MNLKLILLINVFFISQFIIAQNDKNEAKLLTNADSLNYCIGVNIGSSLKSQGFSPLNIKLVSLGLENSFNGSKTLISTDMASQFIQKHYQAMQQQKGDANKVAGEKFLAENKTKKGVVTTSSGLQYMVIKEGTGATPGLSDNVTTHYTGTLIDGTVFDSSVERGQPASFPVNGVIPGWTEALQLMKAGSKWKLFIPFNLAYGERGAGAKIGPYSALIFEIELISVDKK